jgi:photosystem II stability/assembly factor-like uncharacterized protein
LHNLHQLKRKKMRKLLLAATAIFSIVFAKAQWQIQNPGFTSDTVQIYELSLPDKNTAWGVCYDFNGGLLGPFPTLSFTRTVNSGHTWTPGKMGSDKTLRFSNISAINGEEAWVAMHKRGPVPGNYAVGDQGSFGRGGGIYHTTNGGVTWTHTEPGEIFNDNSVPRFVHFKDKNHGIAVGDPNGGYFEIYLTNNKGKKWKRVAQHKIPAPLDGEQGWISGYAVIGNTIWFGTDKGRMYKSVDFGQTWTVIMVEPIPGTHVHEIAFLDDGVTGVAHLRHPATFRTFVYSTLDGGLTWTNYFQPPNWKNSRMTAVPGTNAFVSTSVSQNVAFTGSSVSYDAGKTWTHIDQTGSKAACRFYDAHTGYAGGLHVSGHPVFGTRGMFKSQIVFETLSQANVASATVSEQPAGDHEKVLNVNLMKVFPIPARDVINVVLQDAVVNTEGVVSIHSLDGKLLQSTKLSGTKSMQLNVSKLPAGVYMLRIASKSQMMNKVITIVK